MKKFTKIASLVLLSAAFTALTAKAENRIYTVAADYEPSTSATISIALNNEIDIYGFQADFVLPKGLNLATKSNGQPDINLVSDRFPDSYQLMTNVRNGVIHLGTFSTSLPQPSLIGNTGPVLVFNVNVADDWKGGNVKISAVKFVGPNDIDVPVIDNSVYLGVLPVSIALDPPEVSIIRSETAQLTPKFTPSWTTNKAISWQSSDNSVAVVSADGVVTAAYRGSATITVTTVNGKTATTEVTVLIPTTDLTVEPVEVTMEKGSTQTLIATQTPFDTTDELVWTSSDPSVASVDADGVVTANLVGQAHITVRSGDIEAVCHVTVIISPRSITIEPAEPMLGVGHTLQLTAIVLPEDATDKTVVWSVDDSSIVTVDPETGLLTGVAFGETTVTATCGQVSASVPVAVVPTPADEVIISETSHTMRVGETFSLSAYPLPEDTADKTIVWSSTDETIAKVDAYGTVIAEALGEVDIVATCGRASAVCKVTVERTPVEEIRLSRPDLTILTGHTHDITAIVLPANATDPRVVWSSADPSIASVDDRGNITGHTVGTTEVTATSVSDPDVKATCIVTVEQEIIPVLSISLNKTSIKLIEGETFLLEAVLTPANATDPTVIWRSFDPTIAVVSETGLVTAVKEGETIITASASNGRSVECHVTVERLKIYPTSIDLNRRTMLMRLGRTSDLTAILEPVDATETTLVWASTDNSIASVDDSGQLTVNVNANSLGVATVSATTVNGLTAYCEVTVVPEITTVESIAVDETLVLTEGDLYTLVATILPADATYPEVTWRSNDTSIAEVSETGVVTAIKAGETKIFASSSNGLTATCTVTVLPRPVPVESIELLNSTLLMRVGHTAEPFPVIKPENATDTRLSWTSSDAEIASVDENGVVTALKVGVCTVTVTSANGKVATCEVTVVPDFVDVSSIEVIPSELTLTDGDNYTLKATIQPYYASDQTVTWKSSDISVAIVSEEGVVTALKPGECLIYASASNGLTASCHLTVTPIEGEPESISLTNAELLMYVGDTAEIIPLIRPENALHKDVTWTSADEEIATVDDKGVVTAKKVGQTVITATTVNELTAECKVTVSEEIVTATAIEVDPTSLEIFVGEVASLTATVTPDDVTDSSVTWKAQDKAIAIVSETGIVTGVAPGETIIYASSSNGLTAECHVTVKAHDVLPTGISLTNTSITMIEGNTADIIAIVHPSAADQTVTWASADEEIATVDQNGIVKAVKTGETIVTATTVNGIVAECHVTVIPAIVAVEKIKVEPDKLTMNVGDVETLVATVTPYYATDPAVTWASANSTIATVSDSGVVTAVSPGEVTIYVASSNGLRAECLVTVLTPEILPTDITLTNSELVIYEGETTELIDIVFPFEATDKTVLWESSDEDIVAVDQAGMVTGLMVGNAVVTATTVNGLTATCSVTVIPRIVAVEKIELDKTLLEMFVGDVETLIATVTPETATDPSVAWRSLDANTALVSPTGEVTGVSVGETVIVASTSNGLTAECRVIVKALDATSLALSESEITIYEGQTELLVALIEPEEAANQPVSWVSSNPAVATVDDNGLVTGISEGSVVVLASLANGLSASCVVNVLDRPLTPRQLLRKGDGTTSTFVVLMGIPEAELKARGYHYVFGYTDSEGRSEILADTQLRYCHTTPEIFNEPSYNFWAFTYIIDDDGEILMSNLRHLDGREEFCLDPATYGFSLDSNLTARENWITVVNTKAYISAVSDSPMRLTLFSTSGRLVFAKSYPGETEVSDVIELSRFAPGTYVATLEADGKLKSKKFIVR